MTVLWHTLSSFLAEVLEDIIMSLRVLGTNSLFMSLPVAMDSISKTRAARRTQFVAV